MDKHSWVGKQIGERGRYRVESLLGEGGMSAVYKAVDTRLDRTVAIKIIHSHLSDNEQFVQRFKREGTAVAKLRHPHIIRLLDFGYEGESAYIVLTYIAGGSVQELLQKLDGERMDTATAVTLALQIAEALAYAHKHGLTHRDIKPANIMLNKEGDGILTDFGLVKITNATRFTMTGAVMGTARYMSPEQIKSVAVDHRSDIYSLGVTLFELVSGHPPYDGGTAVTTMMKHLTDPIPDLCTLCPDLPPNIALIIDRAMSKEPENRYQTADDMAADLRLVLASLSTKAAPPRPITKKVLPTTIAEKGAEKGDETAVHSASATTPPPPPAEERSGGKKKWWGVLLLLLLIGGAVAAFFVFNDTGNDVVVTAVPPTDTPIPPTATATATDTATTTATHTYTPQATTTITLTPTPTQTPTPRSVNATGHAERGSGLPYTFDTFGTWVRGDQDNGSLTVTDNAPPNSALYTDDESFNAAKLEYFFPGDGNDFVVFLQNNRINGSPDGLRMWVYGDESGHFLNAWILDAKGQTWQIPFGRVEHAGWMEMEAAIDTDQEWPFASISGADDGEINYPISFRAFVLDDYEDGDSGEGVIYLDQLTAVTLSAPPTSTPLPAAASSQPAATSAPLPAATAVVDTSGMGRIVYVSNNRLLTTDPAWSGGNDLGSVVSNSCSSPATTNTASYPLYFGPYCSMEGNSRCTSPNGAYDIITYTDATLATSIRVGPKGATEDHQLAFIYQGTVNRIEGIHWSPLSDSFFFLIKDTVYRGFPTGGYTEILPIAYEPEYSADGSMILYRKPVGPGVNDVFVANADGSNPRNVTNVGHVDKSCASWVR